MKGVKIGIIGVGHVGAHVMYSIALQGLADEILIVDTDEKKAKSEHRDLFDTVSLLPHRVRIRIAEAKDLGECDVIVNAAGEVAKFNIEDDISKELEQTLPAVRSWLGDVKSSGFDGVVINISDPCDVITREIAKELGLPKGRVFGTGTGIDTARLASILAEKTGIDHKSIICFMLGEHGDDQFVPWSYISFRGKPLSILEQVDPVFAFDKNEVQQEVKNSLRVLHEGKGFTEYAIAMVATSLISSVLHDEKSIMPVSAELDGEYGESGVFVGVPAIIGAGGVEDLLQLPLNAEEQEKFHNCCESIRENFKIADSM